MIFCFDVLCSSMIEWRPWITTKIPNLVPLFHRSPLYVTFACNYSFCFSHSDAWLMFFLIGASPLQAIKKQEIARPNMVFYYRIQSLGSILNAQSRLHTAVQYLTSIDNFTSGFVGRMKYWYNCSSKWPFSLQIICIMDTNSLNLGESWVRVT